MKSTTTATAATLLTTALSVVLLTPASNLVNGGGWAVIATTALTLFLMCAKCFVWGKHGLNKAEGYLTHYICNAMTTTHTWGETKLPRATYFGAALGFTTLSLIGVIYWLGCLASYTTFAHVTPWFVFAPFAILFADALSESARQTTEFKVEVITA